MPEAVCEQRTPDVHELLYNDMRKRMAANDALSEHLSCRVRDLLPDARPQEVEDALNMACVSLGSKPLDALILIHTFLDNWRELAMCRKSNE